MKLGIIAGSRHLPLVLVQRIKQKERDCLTVAVCFRGETSRVINRYVDKAFWVHPGELRKLKGILKNEGLEKCILAGQINPLRIFKKKNWDGEFEALIGETLDFRPHSVFNTLIRHLEKEGVTFLDSTLYLEKDLAEEGAMNGLGLEEKVSRDIDFGVKVISRFTELDVGQTIGVKQTSVIALESLEGTDRTIKRAYKLAGGGCAIFKFAKTNQDLRFDVPVVGISTLKLLKRIRASALVLERGKVIIIKKQEFLKLAKEWGIPVVGRIRV